MSELLGYTKKTAAKALGISPDTVGKAITAGDLKASKPTIDGRTVEVLLIRREDLEEWAFGPTK